MSRIGNRAIVIPSGVTVNVANGEIQVKGPKTTMSCRVPEGISAKVEDGSIHFSRGSDSKEARRLHGLARALTNNMVIGATTGFTRRLEIEGVGYRADVRGKELHLLLGYSHPIVVPIPEGLVVAVDGNTKLSITGSDKEVVGQFAANVRSLRAPEPYKGKGIKYAEERIRRKVGKAGS
ncbi:MAG: 50S ribosomal protein L6 [Deltaproteobacteria bacterium]|nr:50S ribosomal protein L6 [Deltaproteobacteria bacterium]